MSAPKLNRKLVLEAPQRVPDGAGGFTTSWSALGTLWAEVASRTGREASGEAAVLSQVSYKITTRAAPIGSDMRPRPEQRFREGARLFLIQAVTEQDAGGHYLTSFATEEVVA